MPRRIVRIGIALLLVLVATVVLSRSLATRATDRVLTEHGAKHWVRRTLLTLPGTTGKTDLRPFTWLVTYYQDLERPGSMFCESTQFSVSVWGRILKSYNNPAAWAACVASDSSDVLRGA